MKKIIYSIAILLAAVTFSGCTDFFNPVTNDVLLEKKYLCKIIVFY